jgi:hypothetical protein
MLKSLLHQIYRLSLLIALAITSITLIPSQAGAAIYQNPSGSTQLSMDSSNPDSPGRMEYRTKTQDETWSGEINPTKIVKKDGGVVIYGTFQDSPGDRLSDKVFCTGDVIAIQKFAIDRFELNVNWNVTGGKACTEVGTQFKLNLSETTAHSAKPSQL